MTEQEIKELAPKVLGELISGLGFEAKCAVADADAENAFKLELQMEDAGRIIGRKGQTLEALELLLNRILHKNDENAPWAIIDVDGYTTGHTGAERRSGRGPIDAEEVARLEKLALDAAKEVRHWNRERRLGPYMPAERRIIHTALKAVEGVTTESIPAPAEGERMKYILVKLAE